MIVTFMLYNGARGRTFGFHLGTLRGVWFCLSAFHVRLTASLAMIPTSSHQHPSQQQIDRRKSPALWRLLYEEDEGILPDNTAASEISKLRRLVKPEIMAPAGGWPQLKAAVANGADAVYLGLQSFSARARAQNFNVHTDLPRAVQYCHDYGVHVYVALNTLVFDDEMEELSTLVQLCHQARVDAVIVQDLGLCKLIQQLVPDLPIHSSTQQSITSADGVNFCREQHGATRVVLGRELSVDEIEHVSKRTNVEIETFVHGALCVSYSGQCFSSEAWGGRSANRGQCAQACRLPYGLMVNGNLKDKQMMDMKYLLSPQDLCGLDQVPDLIRAGVACLKIEGRLKDETYVAATTRAYRNAVDKAWANLHPSNEADDKVSSSTNKALSLQEDVSRLELTQIFSRGQDEVYNGLTSGFLEGTKHQQLVRGRSPRHRGIHMGRVAPGSSPEFGLLIQSNHDNGADRSPLKLGDGIVIDRGLAQEDELGGPIFSVQRYDGGSKNKEQILVQFGRDVTQKWKRHDKNKDNDGRPFAPVGAHVWKTHDAVVEKKFRNLSQAPPPRQWIKLSVRGAAGKPLQLVASISGTTDVEVVAETEAVLERAEKSAVSRDKILKAIGTFGNTNFMIQGEIDFTDFLESDGLWCPVSQIKQARRLAVEKLEEALSNRMEPSSSSSMNKRLVEGAAKAYLDQWIKEDLEKREPGFVDDAGGCEDDSLQDRGYFSVLCRNYDQVDAICTLLEEDRDTFGNKDLVVSEIVVDFLEIEGMKNAVERIRASPVNIQVVVASPRIIKPEEGGIWKTLLLLEPDALLVRSTGLLHRMQSMGGEGATVDIKKSEGTATTTDDQVPSERLVRIPRLIGDFSLNAANALTAYELLSYGLDRITVSYDLNANSIANMGTLLANLAGRLEVVAHCKMPIFHTEHCIFARFLTKGDSYLNCGHVCTRVDSLHLRDESGKDNLVLADMGCRNTVFAAESQSGIHSFGRWKVVGIRHLRIELVDETPYNARKLARTYASVWKGELKASVAWEILQNMGGVTLGSFKNTKERRAGELTNE